MDLLGRCLGAGSDALDVGLDLLETAEDLGVRLATPGLGVLAHLGEGCVSFLVGPAVELAGLLAGRLGVGCRDVAGRGSIALGLGEQVVGAAGGARDHERCLVGRVREQLLCLGGCVPAQSFGLGLRLFEAPRRLLECVRPAYQGLLLEAGRGLVAGADVAVALRRLVMQPL